MSILSGCILHVHRRGNYFYYYIIIIFRLQVSRQRKGKIRNPQQAVCLIGLRKAPQSRIRLLLKVFSRSDVRARLREKQWYRNAIRLGIGHGRRTLPRLAFRDVVDDPSFRVTRWPTELLGEEYRNHKPDQIEIATTPGIRTRNRRPRTRESWTIAGVNSLYRCHI